MFYSFYREWPDIFHTVSGNSQILLSWSHYRVLLQVNDPEARTWYEQEAAAETWSVRTLQRNISTQYYYRLLSSRDKEPVITEMNQKTALLQEKASFIKNPYILEFLGLPEDPATTESKLENSIITNLQRFLMEFGKGFAFVARQQHIHTEKEDYYIDLVLIILNTFQLSYPRFNYLKWAQEGGLGFMTGTSAAVQSICQRTAYRPYREAGRKAEYGRFSVLPRPEIYRNLRIKDSVKIDPCMGSGHILCVLFDVLVRIYEDYGYTASEAAVKIVENNLWGLDIDDRASQLAYFAVMMKARQYDRRFFTRNIQPHVYAIEESSGITSAPMHDMNYALYRQNKRR